MAETALPSVRRSGTRDSGAANRLPDAGGPWLNVPVNSGPDGLRKQTGKPGGLRAEVANGPMADLASQMVAVGSQVSELLSKKQSLNTEGFLSNEQLAAWRTAATRWPISNLHKPYPGQISKDEQRGDGPRASIGTQPSADAQAPNDPRRSSSDRSSLPSQSRMTTQAGPLEAEDLPLNSLAIAAGATAGARPSATCQLSTPRAIATAVASNAAQSFPHLTTGSSPSPPETSATTRPDTSAIRVPWGATEGGRDKLEWVRALVKYTETHPVYVPREGVPVVSLVDGSPEVRGVQSTIFPNLSPHKREDVHLLAHWLKQTLAHLHDKLPMEKRPGGELSAADGEGLADGAIWVYGVAFDELRRAIAIDSRDRAELLAAMWDHFFSLVETRTAMSYEGTLAQARARFDELNDARAALETKLTSMTNEIKHLERSHADDVALREAQMRQVAQRSVRAEGTEQAHVKEREELQRAIRQEVDARLAAEDALKRLRAAYGALEAAHNTVVLKHDAECQSHVTTRDCCTQLQVEVADQGVAVDTIMGDFDEKVGEIENLKRRFNELQRNYETNELLMVSMQEQLKDRDAQIHLLEARAAAAEQKAAAFDSVIADLEADLSRVKSLLQRREEDLEKADAALEAERASATEAGTEAAAALADFEAALAARDSALARVGEDAAAARKQVATLREALAASEARVETAEAAVAAAREERLRLKDAVLTLQVEMSETDCAEASGIADDDDDEAWMRSTPGSPLHKILQVAPKHMRETWEAAEELRNQLETTRAQLDLETDLRAKLEEELQACKLERAQAVREREAATMRGQSLADELSNEHFRLGQAEERIGTLEAAAAEAKTELEARQAEVLRLMPFEPKTEVLMMEKEALKMKIDFLEEKARNFQESLGSSKERVADLESERASLKDDVEELNKRIKDHEATIRELEVVKQEKMQLDDQHAALRESNAKLQKQYKKQGVKLIQAKVLLKNHLDAEREDSQLMAYTASVDGSLASVPVSACPSVTDFGLGLPSPSVVGGGALSVFAGGGGGSDTSSQVSGYQPNRAKQMRSLAQVSAALAKATAALKLEQQRTTMMASERSELESKLDRLEALILQGDNAGATQAHTQALKDRVAAEERRAQELAMQLTAAQGRIEQLEAQLAEAHRTLASGGGVAADVAELTGQMRALQETVMQGFSSRPSAGPVAGGRSGSSFMPTLEPIPGSRPGTTAGAPSDRPLSGTTPPAGMPAGSAAVSHAGSSAATPRSPAAMPQMYPDKSAGVSGRARESSGDLARSALQRSPSGRPGGLSQLQLPAEAYAPGYDEQEEEEEEEEQDTMSMLKSLEVEMQSRVSASMKLKLNLMAWFCSNLRKRCHQETVARMEAENRIVELEAQYLNRMVEREREVSAAIAAIVDPIRAQVADTLACMPALKADGHSAADVAASMAAPVAVLAATAREWNQRFRERQDKGTQSGMVSQDHWIDFVRSLPRDTPEETLLSHSALSATIVRVLDGRLQAMASAKDCAPDAVVHGESVFDAMASYFSAQLAGDGQTVFMPELHEPDGPLARVILSCGQYLPDPKVRLFAMYTGILPESFLGPEVWLFLLKVLFCMRSLMGINWRLMVKAWPTERGAPVPLQAVMDLFANLYNAETPQNLPIVSDSIAPLIKTSKIGPAIDLDVLLLALVADFNNGGCPVDALCNPRRITDGRMPTLANLGGSALSRSGMAGTGRSATASPKRQQSVRSPSRSAPRQRAESVTFQVDPVSPSRARGHSPSWAAAAMSGATDEDDDEDDDDDESNGALGAELDIYAVMADIKRNVSRRPSRNVSRNPSTHNGSQFGRDDSD